MEDNHTTHGTNMPQSKKCTVKSLEEMLGDRYGKVLKRYADYVLNDQKRRETVPVAFSAHYEVREKERGLDREEIARLVGSSRFLPIIGARYYIDEESRDFRIAIALLYKRDEKHDLHVIVSVNPYGPGFLVVSAREQNVKRRKRSYPSIYFDDIRPQSGA